MNFVIFIPVSLSSPIAKVMCHVSHALIEAGHQVQHVRTERGELLNSPAYDFKTNFIKWTDTDAVHALISQADILIYHIGNNPDYHEGCLPWLFAFPGIVCLHDYFLGNLFYDIAGRDHAYTESTVIKWYNRGLPDNYWTYSRQDALINATKDIMPMTEWICSYASAVITHSHWGIDRVLASCPGPVQVTPLPFKININRDQSCPKTEDGKFNLLTVGDVNENKRIDKVIQAIGASDLLQKNTVYRLAGSISEAQRKTLSSLAKKHKVTLIILGKVDDSQLDLLFDEADAVACLRWPCLEAASASLIESLQHGKPTIATNAASYAEIPDEYLAKIDMSKEVPSITNALEYLHKNPECRALMGKKAASWASNTFSTIHYTEALIKLSQKTLDSMPILNASIFFKSIMAQWNASPSLLLLKDTINPLVIFESNND